MAFVVKSYSAGAQVLRDGKKFVVSCTRCRCSGRPTSDYPSAERAALTHATNVDARRKCLPL